jgi:hypothetical protein
VTAERYTAVFTGILDPKKPCEYTYLTMSGEPLGPGGGCRLCRGGCPANAWSVRSRFGTSRKDAAGSQKSVWQSGIGIAHHPRLVLSL